MYLQCESQPVDLYFSVNPWLSRFSLRLLLTKPNAIIIIGISVNLQYNLEVSRHLSVIILFQIDPHINWLLGQYILFLVGSKQQYPAASALTWHVFMGISYQYFLFWCLLMYSLAARFSIFISGQSYFRTGLYFVFVTTACRIIFGLLLIMCVWCILLKYDTLNFGCILELQGHHSLFYLLHIS